MGSFTLRSHSGVLWFVCFGFAGVFPYQSAHVMVFTMWCWSIWNSVCTGITSNYWIFASLLHWMSYSLVRFLLFYACQRRYNSFLMLIRIAWVRNTQFMLYFLGINSVLHHFFLKETLEISSAKQKSGLSMVIFSVKNLQWIFFPSSKLSETQIKKKYTYMMTIAPYYARCM